MQNKSYEKTIKYSCPEPGWGYPSNGLNEMYSICQSDKSWNITSLDDCECKYSNIWKIDFFENILTFFDYFQYCLVLNFLQRNHLEVGFGMTWKIADINVQMDTCLLMETTHIGIQIVLLLKYGIQPLQRNAYVSFEKLI